MIPPPGIVLAGFALFTGLAPLGLRRWACVVGPLCALAAVQALPDGTSWHVGFLGYSMALVRADALSRLFGVVFCAVAAAGGIYGWHRRRRLEQVASLAYAAAGLLVVFAGDLITMIVGWEVMAVASALLVYGGTHRESVPAGQRYLMVHLAAGGAMLLGVLLAIDAGGTAFDGLWARGAGAWLILAALCVNAAVPPLHAWLPDAYPRATVAGSVFLSAFTTKSAVYCLIRGFPGSELLAWAGAVMAVYGVVYAVLENDMRRLLSYHIVSQVGYMVCGVGVGTPLALSGSAAHAFCHILYKGLLFMAAGAVALRAGEQRLSELGGLRGRMPLTLLFYMIGAFSIAGVPLFNGFISKSLVIEGAAEAGRAGIVLLLELASVGTFLSVALKLPYFAWGREGRGPAVAEAPRAMLAAMGVLATACVVLGVAPHWLYARLPFPVHYEPFTASHVLQTLLLCTGTTVAFMLSRSRLEPHRTVTPDTDRVWRAAAEWLAGPAANAASSWFAAAGAAWAAAAERAGWMTKNPPIAAQRLWVRMTNPDREPPSWRVPPYDPERQRLPMRTLVLAILGTFVVLGALFALSLRA